MKKIETAGKFRKDLKRMIARGFDLEKLRVVQELLRNNQPLPIACRPHKLVDGYTGFWECHIAPDWLLIYNLSDAKTLLLERTGTHSDLF